MFRISVVVVFICTLGIARAENAIKNGTFSDGVNGWSELANDADRTAAVVDMDGQKALQLVRKTAKASEMAVQYNIKLKPETLYRLSLEYRGDCPAAVSFRPNSSKDADYFKVAKSFGTSSCPLPPSKEWKTEALNFDSGNIPDSAFLSVRLDGEQPGTFSVRNISLTETGSAAPDKNEIVILHIGDSITMTSYLPFSERINALLDGMAQKESPKLKVRNINVAADGEYIKEFIDTKRYDKVVREYFKKIDIAVIRYGANDSRFYPAPEYKKWLGTLCDNLKRDYPGIQIVLGTGPFLFNNDEVNKKQYGPYWQAARDVAAEQKLPLADIYKRFETENSIKTAKAVGDMHPGAFGVQLAAETEFEALKPLLKARP